MSRRRWILFPVTWERYAVVARVHGQTVTYPPDLARHPVVQVTWDEAQAFCAWEGKTLPTAEQWEYAARGPQALQFPWGRSFDPSRCNTNRRYAVETESGFKPSVGPSA